MSNNQTDTQKTQMCIEKMIQERHFMCNKCNFNCRKLSEYNRHLVTKKHKRLLNPIDHAHTNATATHKCTCGKIYKHSSGLSRHKHTCKPTNNIIVKTDVVENQVSKEMIISALIAQNKELMNQNKNLMNLIVENSS